MTRRLPKFERLERRLVDPAETTVNFVLGGVSPPVLLHGYPLTHGMRHRAAPDAGETSHRHRGQPARLRGQRQAAVHGGPHAFLQTRNSG